MLAESTLTLTLNLMRAAFLAIAFAISSLDAMSIALRIVTCVLIFTANLSLSNSQGHGCRQFWLHLSDPFLHLFLIFFVYLLRVPTTLSLFSTIFPCVKSLFVPIFLWDTLPSLFRLLLDQQLPGHRLQRPFATQSLPRRNLNIRCILLLTPGYVINEQSHLQPPRESSKGRRSFLCFSVFAWNNGSISPRLDRSSLRPRLLTSFIKSVYSSWCLGRGA